MTYRSGRCFAFLSIHVPSFWCLYRTLTYKVYENGREEPSLAEIKVIKTDHPHNNNTNLFLCMNIGYLSYFRYMLVEKIKGFITCFVFPLRDEQVESRLTLNKQAGIQFFNNYIIKYERGQCIKTSRTRYDLFHCCSTVNYNY